MIVSGLPGGLDDKESPCHAGDAGLIPGLGRSPGEREWQPTPVFLPGEFHGQRSLAGYSPWSPRELDTIERLTLSDVLGIIIALTSYYSAFPEAIIIIFVSGLLFNLNSE